MLKSGEQSKADSDEEKLSEKTSKESPISAEPIPNTERDPLEHLIKKMMQKKYIEKNNFFIFKYKDIIKVINAVKSLLESEKSLVVMTPPCVVVGDIHGQYPDLVRMFRFFDAGDKPGYSNSKYVFLGDYVDRGKCSLECIMLLFLLKIKYPRYIVLLRGNHESRNINFIYGFREEILERYTIPKPLADPMVCPLAMDLMWADPMYDIKGFEPNTVRGVSVHFGEDAVRECINRLGVKMIIRAHQMILNGFHFFSDRKLLTIFTAPSYYPAKANRGAVVRVDKNGHIGFKILIPPEIKGRGEKVFRGAHDEANTFDFGHIAAKKKPGTDYKPSNS